MASGSCSPRKKPCTMLFPQPPAPTQIVLESSGFSSKILNGLALLRQGGELCDYTLVAENQEFLVHKAVMVACSDYFRAMLTGLGNMKETRSDSVELKGVSALGLRVVVEFAYTGRINLSLQNLEEVLAAATHLQIAEAVELSCKFMELAITTENCVDLLNLAELYVLEESKAKTRGFLLQHFETFAESSQYFKLNHSQLASLLSENSLKVLTEYKLFELVLRWINHSKLQREQHVAELMSRLRLPLLSGEELVDKVSAVEIMRHNRACVDLLTEAKDYHIVVSKQPLLQTRRTQVRSEKKSLVMCHAENLQSYDFDTERHAFLKDSPVPLYNPCVCVVDNFMYACGGKYDSNENNEIATARCFRYDPRFDSWFELASMNEARKDFVMVAHDYMLYAIAGQDENLVMCTLEVFSIAKNDWETRSSLNHAVYGLSGAISKGIIYISGGQKFDGHCNNMLSYDCEHDQWKEEPPMIHARSNHVMMEVRDMLYVAGGNTEDSYGFPVPCINIETFNPATKVWTDLKTTINIREAGASVQDDQIFIVGGIDGNHYYSDEIQCFKPLEGTLQLVNKFPTRIYGKACCFLSLPQYL